MFFETLGIIKKHHPIFFPFLTNDRKQYEYNLIVSEI